MSKITNYFKSQVKVNEIPSLIWSFLYFYFLLTGYFILRPIREEMGVTVGPENYDILFSATFIVMLMIQPIYGKIVSIYSRKQFIPIIYGFFALVILLFWAMFNKLGTENGALARMFFVFVSVYNVFVVSIFWSFMSDVYNEKQGTRLFGIIATGGSTGGITGSIITATLVHRVGTINLMLVSVAFLLFCIFSVYKIGEYANQKSKVNKEVPLGGSPIEGVKLIISSKLLQQLALMAIMSVLIGGIYYYLQGVFVKESYLDRDTRTGVFANINIITNIITLFFQLILIPFFLQKIKIHKILSIYPILMIFTSLIFGIFPVIQVVLGVTILQRSGAYGIMKPPTDWLFTSLNKNMKYKFKIFLDTVVYRGGDVFTQVVFIKVITHLTKDLRVFAIFGVLFSIALLVNAIKVGRLASVAFKDKAEKQ